MGLDGGRGSVTGPRRIGFAMVLKERSRLEGLKPRGFGEGRLGFVAVSLEIL